ncbi:MAG: hypothetical protein LBD23_12195 [Oscillospiraceae bacterium]|jgi:hypothetical protein|nr:hypothetical protein [Oscillospiraceae bacterium]
MTNNIESFKSQIQEDIQLISTEWGYIDENLKKPEYAFNYWILSRIFSIDEELILDSITEYNDKCIDCFAHFPDSKELIIIQNKYYDDDTVVNRGEVADFLKTPISVLMNNEYRKSPELQKLFNECKDDSEYKISLYFFSTTDKKSGDINSISNNLILKIMV